MVIVYTAGCVLGFLLSSMAGEFLTALPILQGGQLTVGASAPIFGLLGALVYYGDAHGLVGHHQPGLAAGDHHVRVRLSRPGTDNWAHAGGFAGGYLAALWLDPLEPERVDHMLWAVICLALSVLSILVSCRYRVSRLAPVFTLLPCANPLFSLLARLAKSATA